MTSTFATHDLEQLAHCYLDAKAAVVAAGFEEDILQAEAAGLETTSERALLAEGAWVIFNAGMRERVVRGCFPTISAAFHEFSSAARIRDDAAGCRQRALGVFNHPGKVDAVIVLAEAIASRGFEQFLGD